MNNYCVITTINLPTKAVEKLYEHFGRNLIIVADKKTPPDWNYNGYLPLIGIDKLYAPDNHYAKKNIGYLLAMQKGAKLIYDTDDDNIPNENWKIRNYEGEVDVVSSGGWLNVYRLFGVGWGIWPRGFSLKRATAENYHTIHFGANCKSSIQQGMADGEADVDAIHRLIFNKKVSFTDNRSVVVDEQSWCPFNSQSTFWFPRAFPLMYLPIYATFRMTDIWRSFVAQKCLWELGEGVTFHSPSEVFQDRNEHDLMDDFEDEIPGYLNNDDIVEILGELELLQGDKFVCDNLLTCYEALVYANILPKQELDSVTQWVKDYNDITRNL